MSASKLEKIGTYHVPALLNETVDLLNIRPGKKYLDATLGGGGHSEEIVKRGGILLGIDQDPEALSYASIRLKQACPGLTPPKFAKGNFVNLAKLAEENGFEKVDGVLFDLGVSSHQFESASRGFSFSQEVSLDMRMDPALSVTAKDLVNGLTEKELAELFTKLGEEKFSGRYAKAIVRYRQNKQIEKCSELAQIIVSQAPPSEKFRKIHPATRVFQALRIAVNDELNSLKESLPQSVDLLNQGGRLVVISFHSLEDGVVKRFFLEKQKQNILKIINSKPIIPSGNEIKLNPRSRSAKLRGAEKL